jgi:thermitase
MEIRRSIRWFIAFTCTATLLGCSKPYGPPTVGTTLPRTPQTVQQPAQDATNKTPTGQTPQYGEIVSPANQVISGDFSDVNGILQGAGLDEDAPIGALPEGADFGLLQPKIISNQLILELKPGTQLQSSVRGFATASGGQMVQTISVGKQFAVIQLPAGMSLEDGKRLYATHPAVTSVGENRVYGVALTPNDPSFGDQWAYDKIKPEAVWDQQIDASKVTVAVLDTGIDYTHPELEGRVIKGYNFVDNSLDVMDRFGHGTHVAGIIGAKGNNGIGVAGLAWNVNLLAVKVLGDNGQGSTAAVMKGIQYAADMGAKVINMSLGSPDTAVDPALAQAIAYATSKGSLVVAAAGNNRGGVGSPANDPGALAVSSTSKFLFWEYLSWFSNRGDKIEVSAPGGGIWSTVPMNPNKTGATGYGKLSGTSMACPMVAAEAALLFAKYPAWTNQMVRTRIVGAVDDKGANGRDAKYGFGRINLAKALL